MMQQRNRQWAGGAAVAFALVVTGFAGNAQALPITGQGTWETTLQARDIDGNPVALGSAEAEFFYDTILDITWLGDWNLNNGRMQWDDAVTWASGLTVGGFDGWRLPSINEGPGVACGFGHDGTNCGWNVDTSTSELAHMWYDTLGNLALVDTSGGSPQDGWGLTNTAYFTNMQSSYWSGTEYALDTADAWRFTSAGLQSNVAKANVLFAVAVRPGDVAAVAVPEPGSFALLLGGLLALGLRYRRRLHP